MLSFFIICCFLLHLYTLSYQNSESVLLLSPARRFAPRPPCKRGQFLYLTPPFCLHGAQLL